MSERPKLKEWGLLAACGTLLGGLLSIPSVGLLQIANGLGASIPTNVWTLSCVVPLVGIAFALAPLVVINYWTVAIVGLLGDLVINVGRACIRLVRRNKQEPKNDA